MDFSLSDEQAMLKESVVQYLEKSYSFDDRMRVVDSDQPFSQKKWQEFADLGWLSLPFPLDDDGFGGGPIELMLMMQELGKSMVIEPYLASIVFAGGILNDCPNKTLRAKLLPKVMAGEIQLAVAYAEARSRFNIDAVACKAVTTPSGYQLTGQKIVVLNGASADFLFVSARCEGVKADYDGVTLFCVPAASAGLSMQAYKTVDGMHAAHITFANVEISDDQRMSELGGGSALLDKGIQTATLAAAAEAVGIMDALTQKTVEYTKNRQQFGVPLSSFQALQHRMVEMFMELEQSRSLLLCAAIQATERSSDAASAIAAIKYYVGTAGRKLGEEAVQLHGGMGVSREMDVAHLFMRLTVLDTLFGNADYQLSRYLNG